MKKPAEVGHSISAGRRIYTSGETDLQFNLKPNSVGGQAPTDRMRRREFVHNIAKAAFSVPIALRRPSSCEYQPAKTKYDSDWKLLLKELEKQIPQLMKESTVPGLSITIIKDARLFWSRGFGVRDEGSKQPVNTQTVFQAASTSKPVFAYAVMKLCERGVIALDTPLTKYTSERFIKDDPRLDLITARHVLSHTSGFPNFRSEQEPLKLLFILARNGRIQAKPTPTFNPW